jgi:hypothetical protein
MLELAGNINNSGIKDASDLAAYIRDTDMGAVIRIGGDSITLVGVSADELAGNLSAYVRIV